MFPVLANKKLEMCCAVSSVGTEVAARNAAIPVFPLPCGAAVCRRLLKESGAGGAVGPCLSFPSVLFSVDSIDFSCRCSGRSKEPQGTSSLLDVFLTWLLKRQQQMQPLLLALLRAVFQPFSTEPTNYTYFSLSCIWHVSDEILSKIFVLFAIYSDVMSVLVTNKRVGEFKLWKHHEQHHDTHVPRILVVMKIYRCWS